jgi:plasmid stabilization system protein ParE
LITIEFRDAATHSLFDLADYFASAANQSLARRWNGAVDKNVLLLKRFPSLGSPCFFHHPALKDLRRLSIEGFPQHLLFYRYFDAESRILIFDIVHGARDLEPLLSSDQ